ncbi:MAG: hypothetical protein R3F11_28845 [Verrucomicrobiales bacterium]
MLYENPRRIWLPFRAARFSKTLRLAKEEPAPPLPKAVDRDLATIAAAFEKPPPPAMRPREALYRRPRPVAARRADPRAAGDAAGARRQGRGAAGPPPLLGTAALLLATLGVGGPTAAARQKALRKQRGKRGEGGGGAAEAEARQVAEDRAGSNRHNLYVAEMSLAQQANRFSAAGAAGRPSGKMGARPVRRGGPPGLFLRAEAERQVGGFPRESPRGMRGIPGSTSRPATFHPAASRSGKTGIHRPDLTRTESASCCAPRLQPDGSKVAAGGGMARSDARRPLGHSTPRISSGGKRHVDRLERDWLQIAVWIARLYSVLLDAERLEPVSVLRHRRSHRQRDNPDSPRPLTICSRNVHASYLYLVARLTESGSIGSGNPEFYLSVEWPSGGEYLHSDWAEGMGQREVRQAKSGGALPAVGRIARPLVARRLATRHQPGATIWDVESETATALLNGQRRAGRRPMVG